MNKSTISILDNRLKNYVISHYAMTCISGGGGGTSGGGSEEETPPWMTTDTKSAGTNSDPTGTNG